MVATIERGGDMVAEVVIVAGDQERWGCERVRQRKGLVEMTDMRAAEIAEVAAEVGRTAERIG
ncbi:hypothetical protein AMTR_s00117p00032150 [Amborella trichopoda]|uniref:Uncharacterized protein n=1 Tax=Amborella trichopoda TaxID=13333 RepID=W1NQB1_AMBTC|nr:hypothetical protein AMTR_s00117p00032150 [Amborella trichopoda]